MDSVLEGLNEKQREAVTTVEGFVRVIAGAGSGKTRALSHRFAFLVNEVGILPGNILCVTFTNKSAGEMRQRIRRLTGDSDTGYISTFHSFCVSVLQEDISAVGYPKTFLVLDNADIDAMLKLIYEERGLTLRHMTFAKARDMIEIRKLEKNPDYYEDMIALPLEGLRQKYRIQHTPQKKSGKCISGTGGIKSLNLQGLARDGPVFSAPDTALFSQRKNDLGCGILLAQAAQHFLGVTFTAQCFALYLIDEQPPDLLQRIVPNSCLNR